MSRSSPKILQQLRNWRLRQIWWPRLVWQAETTATIRAWAYATFGPPKGAVSVVDRAQKELNELREKAVAGASPADLAEEAADVVIVLCRLFGWADVDRKMAINRQREWVLDGNGHGQHVHKP